MRQKGDCLGEIGQVTGERDGETQGGVPSTSSPGSSGWPHAWPCSPLSSGMMPPLVSPEETIPLSSECISLLPGVLPHALCMPTHKPTSSLQADVWDRAGLTQLGANLLFFTHYACLVEPGRPAAPAAVVQVRIIPQACAGHCGTKLQKCHGTSHCCHTLLVLEMMSAETSPRANLLSGTAVLNSGGVYALCLQLIPRVGISGCRGKGRHEMKAPALQLPHSEQPWAKPEGRGR